MKLKVGYSYFWKDQEVTIIHVAKKKGWADVRDCWGRVVRISVEEIRTTPDPEFFKCKRFQKMEE